MNEHRIGIFISHSWSYTKHYDVLSDWIFDGNWGVGQAPNRIPINFVDLSIPKDDPIHNAPNAQALQQAIYEEIAKSHIVVIPTGMYASHSKWIGKEIEGAQGNCPILAVNPWGQEKKSSVVVDNATDSVGWKKKSVVEKIWSLYDKYYRQTA